MLEEDELRKSGNLAGSAPTDFMEDDDDDTLALPGFVKEQDNPLTVEDSSFEIEEDGDAEKKSTSRGLASQSSRPASIDLEQ